VFGPSNFFKPNFELVSKMRTRTIVCKICKVCKNSSFKQFESANLGYLIVIMPLLFIQTFIVLHEHFWRAECGLLASYFRLLLWTKFIILWNNGNFPRLALSTRLGTEKKLNNNKILVGIIFYNFLSGNWIVGE